jgi:serine/threonine-protein kinase
MGSVGFCWGANDYGQLGDSTLIPSNVPVTLDFPGIRSLTTRLRTTCVVLATGNALCFGKNDRGEVGGGNFNPLATPTRVLAF